MPNPEPVPQSIVCSTCALPWAQHKKARGRVTKDECIRLLLAELASRPRMSYSIQSGLGNVTSLPGNATAAL